MNDRTSAISQKMASFHNLNVAQFQELVAERQAEVSEKLLSKTKLSALMTATAAETVLLTTSQVVFTIAVGSGALFAGSIAHNFIRHKFGDHERTAINDMRTSAVEAHSKSAHDYFGKPLPSASSDFIGRVFLKIRQSALDIKRDLDVALQRFSQIPASLDTSRVEMNQQVAAKTKDIVGSVVPMTSSGLNTLRHAVARQIQGFADIVNPDVKTRSAAEVASAVGDKMKTAGANVAQKTLNATVVAAAPLIKAKQAVDMRLNDAKNDVKNAASAVSESVTNRMALVKSFISRVQSAYHVLTGELQVAAPPKASASVPAARFIQPIQDANYTAAATIAPAVTQMQQVREARVESARELATANMH